MAALLLQGETKIITCVDSQLKKEAQTAVYHIFKVKVTYFEWKKVWYEQSQKKKTATSDLF